MQTAKLYVEKPDVMIKKEIRRSILVGALVLILAGGLIVLMIFQIKKYAAEAKVKQNLINKTMAQNILNINLKKDWGNIEPYLGEISNALPEPTDLLNYQTALEKLSSETGVQISINFPSTATTTKSTNNKQNYSVVDHQVQVKGDLNQLSEFITGLENLPYYVGLSRFNIAAQSGESTGTTTTLHLKLYTSLPAKTPGPTSSN